MDAFSEDEDSIPKIAVSSADVMVVRFYDKLSVWRHWEDVWISYLAVGDPYYGVESLEYTGLVSIYLGQLEGSAYNLTFYTVLGSWLLLGPCPRIIQKCQVS